MPRSSRSRRATGDRAHLAGAKRLLDEALAKVPEEHHEAMRTNVRVHREIRAAWNAESDGGDDRCSRAASPRLGGGS